MPSKEVHMTPPVSRGRTGRLFDPVFLSMIGAVLLAVGSGILLRAMVGNAPASAHAADLPAAPAGGR
jgi:hypothetical protein